MSIKNIPVRIKGIIERERKSLREYPLFTIDRWIPWLIKGVAVIGFIVAYIAFLKEGTYPKQWEMVREEQYWGSFTWGTVEILQSAFVIYPMNVLCVGSILVIVILFFVLESKKKKIFMALGLGMGLISLVGFGVIMLLNSHVDRELLVLWANGDVIVGIVGVILTVIVMSKSRISPSMYELFKAIAFGYVAVPLALLCLENIIPLFFVAIAAVILGIIFKIFLAISCGSAESAGYSERTETYSGSEVVSKAEAPIESKKEEPIKPQGKVIRYPSSCKVFLHSEGLGTYYVYVCDYASLLSTQDKPELRTKVLYSDFQSGKIVIEVGYQRVLEKDLIKNHFPY